MSTNGQAAVMKECWLGIMKYQNGWVVFVKEMLKLVTINLKSFVITKNFMEVAWDLPRSTLNHIVKRHVDTVNYVTNVYKNQRKTMKINISLID